MRPAGDIRHALLKAAHEFKQQGQQPTLRDLAQHAQVGIDSARRSVDNMRRAGLLAVAGERRVDYRNKPVAVYAPADVGEPAFVDLAQVFTAWAN